MILGLDAPVAELWGAIAVGFISSAFLYLRGRRGDQGRDFTAMFQGLVDGQDKFGQTLARQNEALTAKLDDCTNKCDEVKPEAERKIGVLTDELARAHSRIADLEDEVHDLKGSP